MGKVYLVGAGPGDLKLITVRGLELIQEADVIIYDNLVNKELLIFARKDAEIIYAGKQASRHELTQKEINELLLDKAKKNNIVVRLKGGDPFIFGRGGEEALFLKERGVNFEICPGVTSAISVPAYAGIPLTHRNYASTVAFITGHEDESKKASTINWRYLATGTDTLVFLMGIKNLNSIKKQLIANGRNPDTETCIIQNGTLPSQKVVKATLGSIDNIAKKEGIKPPGIIVVGKVVGLREHLEWFEKKPLFNKKIVITRAPHQSSKFGKLLSEKGADVIYMPTIDIKPIKPNKKLKEAINSIKRYYAIIFTSANSVNIFFDALFKERKDTRVLNGAKIIPIGEATSSMLLSKGVIPDLIPEIWTSEGIIEVLKKLNLDGKRFLLPRAEEARDIIVEYIRNNGGSCDVVPLYKTTFPAKTSVFTDVPDVITFTSSSTVKNFLTIYGDEVLKKCLVASIGPITTDTLKGHEIDVHIQAQRFDIQGFVEAIEQYFINISR